MADATTMAQPSAATASENAAAAGELAAEQPSAEEPAAIADSASDSACEEPAAADGGQAAVAGEHAATDGELAAEEPSAEEPASTAAEAAQTAQTAASSDSPITMRSLGFNSSDEEEAASPTAAEPGSPVGAIKPPTPPGTWPLHLPPPEGACDAAKVYKFYHNAYTIKAGGMYDDNFLVAGVMLDDRDMAKPSAYLVMVEAAMPSKGVRLIVVVER